MHTVQETIRAEPQVLPQILLMEDEPSVGKGLQMTLKEEGYRVDWAMTGQSALETFSRKGFDLLVADLRLPDIDGMEVIKHIKEQRPETEVIVITGYSTVPSAVEAMKLGAYDYLLKPFTEDEFRTTVQGALKQKEEVSVREILDFFDTEEGKLIQKGEVIRVLNRTAQDYTFWRDLMERGSIALDGYRLSMEAKAALVSGDLKWIRQHVGELTRDQLRFIYKRLEREAW